MGKALKILREAREGKHYSMWKVEELLKTKPFETLLDEGVILDVKTVAARTGFTTTHVRRLCDDGKLAHFIRNDHDYYFLPEYISGLFKFVPARSKKV